jgi:hypothetical protein
MLLRNPTWIQRGGRKLWYHGKRELLDERLHAVLCSKTCRGEKIIEAIDLAQRWRADTFSCCRIPSNSFVIFVAFCSRFFNSATISGISRLSFGSLTKDVVGLP